MKEHYQIQADSVCRMENVITGEQYRISVITTGLIRLEYAAHGIFEDRPTQTVWNRNLGVCDFQVIETENSLEVITDRVHLRYNKQEFCENGLSIEVKGGLFPYGSVWRYGNNTKLFNTGDLKGTARTLDNSNGEIPLENGLISKMGYAEIDDSNSLVICESGWVEPRKNPEIDLYVWCYGTDYLTCIQDFYRLCGVTPMVPRYALGNWWSRFHKYTEQTYRELMERFTKEEVPLAVAVIDMDWHLVNIDPKYGSGWTGYTWNKEFFPDPKRFLNWLHERGLHVTLNVHPADGVRAYEEMYEPMAKALGVDTEKELPIEFDVSNEKFMEAYFTYLHHPREEEGVDFWWVDWQQGGVSKVEGLDPLWMLNHYHFLDNGRNGKRPMTFSRYAGPGSHRYPIGFSGDTVISWKSLDFQPYFTASASNIGYGMWSHDIGGHMMGVRDDELSGRWVQFGVFSPIMRLHATDSMFTSKEPWRYRTEICMMMEEFLRLRHRMLPYLYTMDYRQYAEKIPMILPMYYSYPQNHEAYQIPNQYMFGSEMMVAAITTPCIEKLGMAKIAVWFPEGEWYDIFTGLRYRGGRKMNLYRDMRSIPVFARTGTVIPFQEDYMENAGENPRKLHLYVYVGANGCFTLYEDDNYSNAYQEGKYVRTKFEWQEDEGCLQIGQSEGELALIPEKRDYVITFCGLTDAVVLEETPEGFVKEIPIGKDGKGSPQIVLENVSVREGMVLRVKERKTAENNVVERCFDILDRAKIEMVIKEGAFRVIEAQKDAAQLMGSLLALELDTNLYGALAEVITAR